MFHCCKLPCLGWRSADFLQGFFCPKLLQGQLKHTRSSTKISMYYIHSISSGRFNSYLESTFFRVKAVILVNMAAFFSVMFGENILKIFTVTRQRDQKCNRKPAKMLKKTPNNQPNV
jgi:hypothetical protein